MRQITITAPDDWHVHLRDGVILNETVARTSAQFQRAIVMPNLLPPVVDVDKALSYRNRIIDEIPEKQYFEPLMTLYLTEATSPKEVVRAKESGFVKAFKLYPAGATTNSKSGVTDFKRIEKTLEAMEKVGLPLLIHAEVTDDFIDIFDREKVFIDSKLLPMMNTFPQLKIVVEHITTKEAVQFVVESNERVAATITAHHLLYNRNDMLVGGIKPHYYCLPILKRSSHQQALIEAATSGHPKFFLGTDSAPHVDIKKESACGCAGCYTAPFAIELYAEAFDSVECLDKLEGFASFFGADFYGLSHNENKITLKNEDSQIPRYIKGEFGQIVPLRAGGVVKWSLVN